MANGRAKVGGQTGVNGYHYKGGQYLPSTDIPPGLLTKNVKPLKKEQVEPYKWELQPSVTMRSIYTVAYSGMIIKNGIATIHPLYNHDEDWSFGYNGIPNTKKITIGELIDLYNSGERWINAESPA
ncbi:hypothetical protein [Sporomusa sphaeroides]|uniref:Uncharacterized protein n=1 Tax=Sporomusa sphaeroides DSM 2875 TaxID=1337886 RepID=A0A1U7M9T9_9FIRM|nr:hypothetical protein [Sporomusa sphaeroides]OLS54321.1 hypothetical protein SPSPH_45670 [Sporomusa sphaeroides DSM 2875]CVK21550.1 hypothetical protein SSPH_04242 [Sporomusa sphaeroides DSM 2875]